MLDSLYRCLFVKLLYTRFGGPAPISFGLRRSSRMCAHVQAVGRQELRVVTLGTFDCKPTN